MMQNKCAHEWIELPENWQSSTSLEIFCIKLEEMGSPGPERSSRAEVCFRADWRSLVSTPKGQPHDQPSSTEPRVTISVLLCPWPCTHWMATIAYPTPPLLSCCCCWDRESFLSFPEFSHMTAPWWRRRESCHQWHSSTLVGLFAVVKSCGLDTNHTCYLSFANSLCQGRGAAGLTEGAHFQRRDRMCFKELWPFVVTRKGAIDVTEPDQAECSPLPILLACLQGILWMFVYWGDRLISHICRKWSENRS